MSRIDELATLAEVGDWDVACQWAEDNMPEVADHLRTWGSHCGAHRNAYRGHIVSMLVAVFRAERHRCRAAEDALYMLCTLKANKERHGKTEFYQRAKHGAWSKAMSVIDFEEVK